MSYRILSGLAVFIAIATMSLVWGNSENNNKTQSLQQSSVEKTETQGRFLAPDFELQNLSGKTVRLSDFAGQVRIVDFWATWCLPCRQGIPHFQALYETYKDKGVTIIGISLDHEGFDVVRSFAKKMGITYPTVMGHVETAQAFGDVRVIPTAFLIDQKGFVVKKYVGYKEREVFETDILALLGKK